MFQRALLVVLACVLPVLAARAQIDTTDLIEQADAWVGENIDDSVLDALGVDRDRTRRFLDEIKKQFQGAYVYDLGAWRETATQLQPILAGFEETAPYAAWLKAHLDYFEVSEMLRQQAAPKTTNSTLLPPPAPQVERAVWVKVLEARPPPTAPANRHVARLKPLFTAEGVPAELVWIAEVESSFDARARSPVGAAGLFQLMPVTARSLGLSVGFLRDERLDAEKSGRAAARYLRHLHARFGDWRLVFAAYNSGETRVAELLRKHKARTFDGIARHLPLETRMFVPKVEATIRKRENVDLDALRMVKGRLEHSRTAQ